MNSTVTIENFLNVNLVTLEQKKQLDYDVN